MKNNKSTFALYFGNRGFFPESLIAEARKEVSDTLQQLGHKCLLMDCSLTRFGAVESPEEGRKYALFLKITGANLMVSSCVLPNFGDETGAVSALQDCTCPHFHSCLSRRA